MCQDRAAVQAGVAGAWSNGQMEGQVNRLKLVKRAGYGRAGFEHRPRRLLTEDAMVPADLLRRLRNDLPLAVVIAALGRDGPPSKVRDGRFVFLCPHCSEMLVYVNPRNNLAHCFACHRNLNTIDLLRVLGYDFPSAVALLEEWLDQYRASQPRNKAARGEPRVGCG